MGGFDRVRVVLLGLGTALVLAVLAACADAPSKQLTRWDAYYARSERPRAHVVVIPPQGSTVPMAKLIAEYVVDNLTQRNISAVVGDGRLSRGRYFVLTGVIEGNASTSQSRFNRLIRWSLSDSQGRIMSSHTEGVDGTDQEWDFGSGRLLNAIGIGTAGPVAQMILAETKALAPLDPLRRGLLVESVSGLTPDNAARLTQDVRAALRASDVQVTGDPRQASFRLTGQVQVTGEPDGTDKVRIVWRVLTMDRQELGHAVQENNLPRGDVQSQWALLSPRVAKAAAVGVEHVFGTRSGPLPGAANRATGQPPEIVLPGVVGRAPPPPR